MLKLTLLLNVYLVLFQSYAYVSSENNDNALLIVDQTESNEQNDDSSEVSVEDDDHHSTDEIFSATDEWQPIKKGQVVPPGLHIRINLQTGLKEAKLLDPQDSNDDNNQVVDKHKKLDYIISDKNQPKANALKDQIKDALKKLKSDSKSIEKNEDNSEDDSKNFNFRSIEQIRQEFSELNIEIRSETEILLNLIERYPKSVIGDKLTILNEVEYLVHQYDVAQDFVKLGSLSVLLPDLNSTNSLLRAQIAFTIGSAMQGNPKVQIAVLKTGALHKLLRLLGYDTSSQVKLRSLYAISCLIRQFPFAQKMFVESGGISVFASLFKDKSIQSMKLNVKAITILNDLITEHALSSKYVTSEESSQLKLKQYEEVNLNKALIEDGFCELVPNLLHSPDYDVREKVINAMHSFAVLCKNYFRNSLPVLESIINDLIELSRNEGDSDNSDFYYSNLYEITSNLVNKLKADIKEEL